MQFMAKLRNYFAIHFMESRTLNKLWPIRWGANGSDFVSVQSMAFFVDVYNGSNIILHLTLDVAKIDTVWVCWWLKKSGIEEFLSHQDHTSIVQDVKQHEHIEDHVPSSSALRTVWQWTLVSGLCDWIKQELLNAKKLLLFLAQADRAVMQELGGVEKNHH